MSLSVKRALSLTICLALVSGVIPSATMEALAIKAKVGGGPVESVSLPVSALAKITPGVVPSPAKTPLKIQVPAETVQNMTPAQKANLETLTKMAEASLFTHEKVDVVLPGTIFDNSGAPIIGADDLFQAPQANELDRLADKYPRLTKEMRDQVYKDGTFSVASEDFPGQTHVFKTASLIQQGYEVSRDLRQDRMASAAAQWVSRLPETITGGTALSLDRTLGNVAEGLRETISLALGFSETRPAFGAHELEQKRLAALAESVRSQLPERDLALYDEKVMEKAGPVLGDIQKAADESWAAKAEAVAEELGKTIKDPQQLADALAQARQENLYAAVASSGRLKEVYANLPALVVQRLRFRAEEAKILADAAKEIAAAGEKTAAALRAKNPILSRVDAWLEKRVEAAGAEYAKQREPLTQGQLRQAAERLGLAPEFAAEKAFEPGWAKARASLESETRANRVFEWRYPIWSMKNWKVERDPETGLYSGRQYTVVERTTKQTLWRLSNMAQRYLSVSSSVLHWLLKDSRFPLGGLAYGPLGWKALFAKDPFPYRWGLDQKTGQWKPFGDPRNTYRSRLSGFYAQRRALWAKFEAAPEREFFLGKGVGRLFNYVRYDIGLGLLVPLVVGVAQPLLTLANTIVSGFLTLATPLVIAPVLAAGVWAFQALVFDYAGTMYQRWRPSVKGSLGILGVAAVLGLAWWLGPKYGVDFFSGWWLAGIMAVLVANGPLFPWVGTLVKKAGWFGAAATVASALKAVVHVVGLPVLGVLAGLTWAGRRAWDNVMKPFIVWKGRVVSKSSTTYLKRIKGPGIGSEYFFQVGQDLPLVAAWASMEASELHRYQDEMKDLIGQPQKAYEEFAAVIEALTGGGNQGRDDAPAYKAIAETQKAHSKVLADAANPRAELYGKLLQVPHQGKVKLATADLESLLKKTAVLAEGFYGEVMRQQAWSEEKKAAFWKGHGLKAGDWVGLAKRLQAGIFGDAILTPFEETDKTLRIEVSAPHLGDYVKGLEEGIMPGQLDKIAVEMGRTQTAPRVEARVPVVTTNDLGGGLL